MSARTRMLLVVVLVSLWCTPQPSAQTTASDPSERDRHGGIPVSMFGTFIERGDLIVYPFFEYYLDGDAEYAPVELGYDLDQDFRGEYRASEVLLYLAYGFTDWLAVEVEAAWIDARLDTASEDPTAIPDRIEESGIGDVEGQIRWRYAEGAGRRPEFFGYFEVVGPTQDEGSLIGTTDWEYKFGSGAIHSWGWGTGAIRAAVEYSRAEDKFEVGEIAVEGLRRFDRHALAYFGVEGFEDEWEAIPEFQWTPLRGVTIKLNSAFGLTSKAADWAPEVGVLVRFPRRWLGEAGA